MESISTYELFAKFTTWTDPSEIRELATALQQKNVAAADSFFYSNVIEPELGNILNEQKCVDARERIKEKAGKVLDPNASIRASVWGQCYYRLQHDATAWVECSERARTSNMLRFATALDQHNLLNITSAIAVEEPSIDETSQSEKCRVLWLFARLSIAPDHRQVVEDLLSSETKNEKLIIAGIQGRNAKTADDYTEVVTFLTESLGVEFSQDLQQRAIAWMKYRDKNDDETWRAFPDMQEFLTQPLDFENFSRAVVGDRLTVRRHQRNFYYEEDVPMRQGDEEKIISKKARKIRTEFNVAEFKAARDMEKYVQRTILRADDLFAMCRSGRLADFNYIAKHPLVRRTYEKLFESVVNRVYRSGDCIFPANAENFQVDDLIEWLKPHSANTAVALNTVRKVVAVTKRLRLLAKKRAEHTFENQELPPEIEHTLEEDDEEDEDKQPFPVLEEDEEEEEEEEEESSSVSDEEEESSSVSEDERRYILRSLPNDKSEENDSDSTSSDDEEVNRRKSIIFKRKLSRVRHELGETERKTLTWQFTYTDVTAGLDYLIGKQDVGNEELFIAYSDYLLMTDRPGKHSGGSMVAELLAGVDSVPRKRLIAVITQLKTKYGKVTKSFDGLFVAARDAVSLLSPSAFLRMGKIRAFMKSYRKMTPQQRTKLNDGILVDSNLPPISNEHAWLTLSRDLDGKHPALPNISFVRGLYYDFINAEDLVILIQALLKFVWTLVPRKDWTPDRCSILVAFAAHAWKHKWNKLGDKREDVLKRVAVALSDIYDLFVGYRQNLDVYAAEQKEMGLPAKKEVRGLIALIGEKNSKIHKLQVQLSKLQAAARVDADDTDHMLVNRISMLESSLQREFRNNELVTNKQKFVEIGAVLDALKAKWTRADAEYVALKRASNASEVELQRCKVEAQNAKAELSDKHAALLEYNAVKAIMGSLNEAREELAEEEERNFRGEKSAARLKQSQIESRAVRMESLAASIKKHGDELEKAINRYDKRPWMASTVQLLVLENQTIIPLQEFISDVVNRTEMRNFFTYSHIPCVSTKVAFSMWSSSPTAFSCDIHVFNRPLWPELVRWLGELKVENQMNLLLAKSNANGFGFLVNTNLLCYTLMSSCPAPVFVALLDHPAMRPFRAEFLSGTNYAEKYPNYLNAGNLSHFDYLCHMPLNQSHYQFSATEIADHLCKFALVTENELDLMLARTESAERVTNAVRDHPDLGPIVKSQAPSPKWSYPKLVIYSRFGVLPPRVVVDIMRRRTERFVPKQLNREETIEQFKQEFPQNEPEPLQNMRNDVYRLSGVVLNKPEAY